MSKGNDKVVFGDYNDLDSQKTGGEKKPNSKRIDELLDKTDLGRMAIEARGSKAKPALPNQGRIDELLDKTDLGRMAIERRKQEE